MRRLYPILAASALLVGCDNFLVGEGGLIRDRSQDYEASQVVPRLQLPDDLEAEPMREMLVVPEIGTAASRSDAEFEVPRPDFFYAETGNQVVNLGRSEQGRQILVDEPLPVVWDQVLGFWDYNDIEVAVTDPQRGVIETAWITDESTRPGWVSRLLSSISLSQAQGPYRDKLRALLVPSAPGQPGQTAIRLQHLRMAEGEGDADWSQQTADLAYQSEMTYELLHYLSKSTEQSTATALQRRAQSGARALLGRDSNGRPVLKLSEDIDRSWVLVEQALQDAGVDVGSSDQVLGKFYLTFATTLPYQAPNKSGGIGAFFAWLHSDDRQPITINTDGLTDGDDAEADGIRYSSRDNQGATAELPLEEREGYKVWLGGRVIYVFGSDSPDALVKTDEAAGTITYQGRFQLQLTRRSSGVYVSVLDENGDPAPAPVAEDLLWKLQEQLPAG